MLLKSPGEAKGSREVKRSTDTIRAFQEVGAQKFESMTSRVPQWSSACSMVLTCLSRREELIAVM